MIELDRHIEILLLDYDCVIVPSFGGFMAHHVNAQYVQTENILLPPSRTIGFNPQLIINDSLLAQSYIETYDVSYPEAIKRILDEVNEIKQHLLNSGCFEFKNIGIIRLNELGKYEFTPSEAGLLTPSIYGLNSVSVVPIKEIVENEAEPQVDFGNSKDQVESILTPNSIDFDNDDDEEEKTIPIKISLLRNIAAACIALIFFFVLPSTLGNGNRTLLSSLNVDKNTLFKILPKDIVTKATYVGKITSPTETEISKKDSSRIPQGITTANGIIKPCFTIVLASRITAKNANDYVAKLKSKGYTDATVYIKKHSIKVVFGKYSSESDAYNQLNKLNDFQEFNDCWVMKIN